MIKFDASDPATIETVVSRLEQEGNKIRVFPMNTNLRSRYGSQLEDVGKIYLEGWQDIDETGQINGEIYHTVDLSLKSRLVVGSAILIKRNEENRLKLSRMHSSIHLLCSFIGADLVRGYVGSEKSRVDFFGDREKCLHDMPKTTSQFFDAVKSDVVVNTLFLTNAEIANRGGVKEFDEKMTGNIRAIEFLGIDTRVCLGTHVRSSAEIGRIRISNPEPLKNKGFKVSLVFES